MVKQYAVCFVPDNINIWRLGVLGFGLYAAASHLQGKPAGREDAKFKEADFVGWSETHEYLPAAQWLEKIVIKNSAA
ncbi:hypothetical protein BGI32_00085 [Snodgrassella alvi]|uniref:Uncharacterized protein n=1 Tax=Snodgrassella alvi TaxID=1196083 RepID=A0A2N9WX00_9NEIS|nr:hypothetical protein [Snodgrassella alvi]PIT19115.1 hypothetical protein BGI32_00085 [Snodgrassella alvi]